MPEIVKKNDSIELESPYVIEGFPGTGLAGKIAVEHLIERLELEYYAFIDSTGLPPVTLFDADEYRVKPAVRVYADSEGQFAVLSSDIPVSAEAGEFVDAVHRWMRDNEATPVYQVGLPLDRGNEKPDLFGVSTGDGDRLLSENGIKKPPGIGAVTGPTGALMERSRKENYTSVGVIVETDPRFPDPEAAKVLVDEGVKPLTGVELNTDILSETADQIREKKERLAKQIRESAEHEASEAYPTEMYQ